MGGNALNGDRVNTQTLNEEYARIQEILPKNVDYFLKYDMVESYEEKETHGDLDILFIGSVSKLTEYLVNKLSLNKNQYLQNGGYSLSILWRTKCGASLQVDFVSTEGSSYQFAKNYYAYNDRGNLYGVLAHRMGFNLGHQGLYYTLYGENKTILLDKILVTHDWNLALDFLGFEDVKPKTMEDIFKAVVKNKYFKPEFYNLEDRNHRSRKRDVKRKVYMEFLAWLTTRTFPEATPINKSEILSNAFNVFYDFEKNYNESLLAVETRNKIKNKFNGDIVNSLLGITEKELGSFISNFKAQFSSKENFNNFILGCTQELINSAIVGFYKKDKNE